MAVVTPINHIAIQEHNGSAVIVGTGLKVAVMAPMYAHGYATLAWILENYDITAAQLYAAVSYYYDHRAEIDQKNAEADEAARTDGVPMEQIVARIEAHKASAPEVESNQP
ncbi:MAG: DUF433 domain-containing protein [Armatimonadetes bacterium]|nr:DUF433 domain-containing protein [Anaerolineae bacterium]